jgi:hypothetical protein
VVLVRRCRFTPEAAASGRDSERVAEVVVLRKGGHTRDVECARIAGACVERSE